MCEVVVGDNGHVLPSSEVNKLFHARVFLTLCLLSLKLYVLILVVILSSYFWCCIEVDGLIVQYLAF